MHSTLVGDRLDGRGRLALLRTGYSADVQTLSISGELTELGPQPITLVLVNDYEVIVQGLAAMLAPYSDRVRIVEMKVGGSPHDIADVALFDTFPARRHAIERAYEMVRQGNVRHVVLYTWDAAAEFLDMADRAGVSGVVLKSTTGAALVDIIERVTTGERIGLGTLRRGRQASAGEGLSIREEEVLALIALGMTNREIGSELFLSVDTVKTYVRRLFAKLGVKNRAQAALCADAHHVLPAVADRRRVG